MVEDFRRKKQNNEKISMLTAYDCQIASILEQTGIDAILVGDSMGMVIQGHNSTREVTIEQVCYHTQAVVRGARNTFIIGDMPYHSFDTPELALKNAQKLVECGAHAVKLEGNPPGVIDALVAARIPVMGHLGLLPQTAESYKVQGKSQEEADAIKSQALAMDQAGIFALVLECIPESLAKEVTDSISAATIGIGAGKYCDGQVLVINDLLGLDNRKYARFVKTYADLHSVINQAVEQYIQDVKTLVYPDLNHTYH